jgi:hypothetical protein
VGLEKVESRFDEDYFNTNRGWEPWMQEAAQTEKAEEDQTIKLDDKPLTKPPSADVSKTTEVETTAAIAAAPASELNEFIRIVCQCGKKVKFPRKYQGKTGRCPVCNNRISIVEQPEVEIPSEKKANVPKSIIHFGCSCGKRFKVPDQYAGKTVLCPVCKNKIKIPID